MKHILINDDLLEEIRTSRNSSKWHDIDDKRIVDFGYTHEYFLANRTVDNIIKEFYLKTIKEMYTRDEWQELTNLDTQNKTYITNHCSYLIKGALHNRVNLYIKIGTLLELKNQHNLHNKYEYLSDLKPYFKSYADNFNRGYRQFLNVIVKPHLLFDNNKEEAAHIIFRFITNNQLNDPVISLSKGFKVRFENNGYDIDYDITDGLIEGYLYKAWGIIFSQNELFQPLFQKYKSNRIIKKTVNSHDKLTINQIALKCFYENVLITKGNANSIIEKYGLKSGHKLYQRFNYYSSRANRKGIPKDSTPLKLQNKIELIESVIEKLPHNCKLMAIDECNILKSKVQNDDY